MSYFESLIVKRKKRKKSRSNLGSRTDEYSLQYLLIYTRNFSKEKKDRAEARN